MIDLLIRGGHVVDGSGAPGHDADVAVEAGRISRVGRIDEPARETLDAEEISACMEGRPLPDRQRVVIPTWSERRRKEKEEKKRGPIFAGPPKPASGEA